MKNFFGIVNPLSKFYSRRLLSCFDTYTPGAPATFLSTVLPCARMHTHSAGQTGFSMMCGSDCLTIYKLGIRMRRVCLAQKNIRKYASRYPL